MVTRCRPSHTSNMSEPYATKNSPVMISRSPPPHVVSRGGCGPPTSTKMMCQLCNEKKNSFSNGVFRNFVCLIRIPISYASGKPIFRNVIFSVFSPQRPPPRHRSWATLPLWAVLLWHYHQCWLGRLLQAQVSFIHLVFIVSVSWRQSRSHVNV